MGDLSKPSGPLSPEGYVRERKVGGRIAGTQIHTFKGPKGRAIHKEVPVFRAEYVDPEAGKYRIDEHGIRRRVRQ
jgi:hypothetical protein